MPELPDVESFKTYFKESSLDKVIADVQCSCKDLIRNINFKDLRHKLIGKSFRDAWRRGKFLICEIKDIPEKLIFHFGMTGDLHYVKQNTEEDRFARLVIKFENEYELRWLSIRKLGKIYLVKDPEEIKLIKEMGPEPKDSIVCPTEGRELFKNSGAEDKEILIIPDADHNTIIGAGLYFPKIKKFVEDYG